MGLRVRYTEIIPTRKHETDCSSPSNTQLRIYGTLPSPNLHLCGVVLKHIQLCSFFPFQESDFINKDAELKEMEGIISGYKCESDV